MVVVVGLFLSRGSGSCPSLYQDVLGDTAHPENPSVKADRFKLALIKPGTKIFFWKTLKG